MLIVLARSLRRHDRCWRDVVLLMGTAVQLAPEDAQRLASEDFKVVHVPPVRFGRATLDKLHAWNLTQYKRLLAIDGDAIALRSLDPIFDAAHGEGTVGAHPYDIFQGRACGIPPGERGQGGFFVVEPRQGGFERAVAHVDANPSFWDMQLSNHTPQQTGINCFFNELGIRRRLSCGFWYDIANPLHVRGGLHWKLCSKWQRADQAVCDDIASRVSRECLWPTARSDAHAIHLKGSEKPWRNVPRACRALQLGTVAAQLGNGSVVRVSALDELVWRTDRCLSRDLQAPVHFDATGVRLMVQCCTFVTLIKAEWWWYQRGDDRASAGAVAGAAPRLESKRRRRGRVPQKVSPYAVAAHATHGRHMLRERSGAPLNISRAPHTLLGTLFVDIDDTLANTSARLLKSASPWPQGRLNLRQYKAAKAVSTDTPIEGSIDALMALRREGWVIVILTARGGYEAANRTTTSWLQHFHIPHDDLVIVKRSEDKIIKMRQCSIAGAGQCVLVDDLARHRERRYPTLYGRTICAITKIPQSRIEVFSRERHGWQTVISNLMGGSNGGIDGSIAITPILQQHSAAVDVSKVCHMHQMQDVQSAVETQSLILCNGWRLLRISVFVAVVSHDPPRIYLHLPTGTAHIEVARDPAGKYTRQTRTLPELKQVLMESRDCEGTWVRLWEGLRVRATQMALELARGPLKCLAHASSPDRVNLCASPLLYALDADMDSQLLQPDWLPRATLSVQLASTRPSPTWRIVEAPGPNPVSDVIACSTSRHLPATLLLDLRGMLWASLRVASSQPAVRMLCAAAVPDADTPVETLAMGVQHHMRGGFEIAFPRLGKWRSAAGAAIVLTILPSAGSVLDRFATIYLRNSINRSSYTSSATSTSSRKLELASTQTRPYLRHHKASKQHRVSLRKPILLGNACRVSSDCYSGWCKAEIGDVSTPDSNALMGVCRSPAVPNGWRPDVPFSHVAHNYAWTMQHSGPNNGPVLETLFGRVPLERSWRVPLEVSKKAVSRSSMIWVAKQGCKPHMRSYRPPGFWLNKPSHLIINAVPGSCEEHYSKKSLCDNLRRIPADQRHGVLQCFSMPTEIEALRDHAASHPAAAYAVKVDSKSSGKGMSILRSEQVVAQDATTLSILKRSSLAQMYIISPHTHTGRKTDVRVYAAIFFDPLRIYVHRDGYLNVAQRVWNSTDPYKWDPFMHISNYWAALPNTSSAERRGRRITIAHLRRTYPGDFGAVWRKLQHSIAVHVAAYATRMGCRAPHGGVCGDRMFQWLGIDVMFEEQRLPNGKITHEPFVLELNNDPGVLQYQDLDQTPSAQMRKRMFHRVFDDLLELVGFERTSKTFHLYGTLEEQYEHRGGFDLAFPSVEGLQFAFYMDEHYRDKLAARKAAFLGWHRLLTHAGKIDPGISNLAPYTYLGYPLLHSYHHHPSAHPDAIPTAVHVALLLRQGADLKQLHLWLEALIHRCSSPDRLQFTVVSRSESMANEVALFAKRQLPLLTVTSVAADSSVMQRWAVAPELNPALPDASGSLVAKISDDWLDLFRIFSAWYMPESASRFLLVTVDHLAPPAEDICMLHDMYPRSSTAVAAGYRYTRRRETELEDIVYDTATAVLPMVYRARGVGLDHLPTKRMHGHALIDPACLIVVNATAWRHHGVTASAEAAYSWLASRVQLGTLNASFALRLNLVLNVAIYSATEAIGSTRE